MLHNNTVYLSSFIDNFDTDEVCELIWGRNQHGLCFCRWDEETHPNAT